MIGFRLTICPFFASNLVGRLSARMPFRWDENSFLSYVLNIEWGFAEAVPPSRGHPDAGGAAGSSKPPALKPEPRKWSKTSRETFRPEWAYVG